MIRQIILLVCVGLCHAYCQATTPFTTVPFIQLDDLILIEVVIDNQAGNFIVDTGAPELFLNKKYFKGRREKNIEQSWDINGQVDFTEIYYTKKLQIRTFERKRMNGRVVDLSHHEKLKSTPIHGILGHAVFKNMELVFDYQTAQLTFHHLDRKGNRLAKNSYEFNHPTDSFELHMARHIPFLVGFVGNKRLRLGIDSGAEINLLHQNALKKHPEYLDFKQSILISGFSKQTQQVKTATLSHLEIDDAIFKKMDFAHLNLKLLRNQKTIQLDGILGSVFIQNCKMSINYRKKKLYLWQTEHQQLAVSKKNGIK